MLDSTPDARPTPKRAVTATATLIRGFARDRCRFVETHDSSDPTNPGNGNERYLATQPREHTFWVCDANRGETTSSSGVAKPRTTSADHHDGGIGSTYRTLDQIGSRVEFMEVRVLFGPNTKADADQPLCECRSQDHSSMKFPAAAWSRSPARSSCGDRCPPTHVVATSGGRSGLMPYSINSATFSLRTACLADSSSGRLSVYL